MTSQAAWSIVAVIALLTVVAVVIEKIATKIAVAGKMVLFNNVSPCTRSGLWAAIGYLRTNSTC